VLATVLLQANHASESWFNKDDVKNVVAHQAPRDTDCHNLVKALIQRHSEDPQFRYKVLLYKDYIKLPGAVPYGHDPDDFMAAVWAEPRQVAMGLAHTYTLSWDATHKTNWLGLKYFDFTTIDASLENTVQCIIQSSPNCVIQLYYTEYSTNTVQ
jgi:hypothetical protein